MAIPLLQVHDLRTHIRTGRGVVRAVDGVTFSLDSGQSLGVVGESGSGKTVLARSVMGIRAPWSASTGEVLFDGRNILALKENERQEIWGKRIAMVFQDPGRSLNPVVRVERQLTEGMRKHLGVSRSEARTRALDLLTEVGIPDPERRLRSYPHEMSGGMRQRVMIAAALACEPDLLIADEPTTALDVTVQRQILDLLLRIQRDRHMSTIFISHDLSLVGGRTDRVAIMYAGRLAEWGSTRTVLTGPRHRYTKALFASTPTITHQRHAPLPLVRGDLPSAITPQPGCRFAPRCDAAAEACTLEPGPIMESFGPDHHAACLFPAGSAEVSMEGH